MKKIVRYSQIFLVIGLASCTISLRLSYHPFSYDVASTTVKRNITADGYYQKDKFDAVSYLDNGVTKTINNTQDYGLAKRKSAVKSATIGENPLLVIPVHFANTTVNPSFNSPDEINAIKTAFFGDRENNEFYSVAEYYMRSSYGALKITGEVTAPFLVSDSSVLPTEKSSSSSAVVIRNHILKTMYQNGFDFSKYIATINGKKYIQNVFFVYDRPYEINLDDSLWWAFSFNEDVLVGDDVYANNTAWASFGFIDLNDNKVKSQTFLHETGHLLGLEDYYSEQTYQPTGGFDMMDLNVGDHTGLSKMLFNWVTPKVITNSCEITIKNFYDSGDLLLIPSGTSFKNGQYHPYQEYLLIEHFTNYGLNSDLNYIYKTKSGAEFKFPKSSGVKVYHVDARLAYFLTSSHGGKEQDTFIKFITDEETALTSPYHVEYRYRNNDVRSADKDKSLYHLLESSGNNTFKNGQLATEDTTFKVGQGLSDFTFNDGTSLPFSFTVKGIGLNAATISFNKK